MISLPLVAGIHCPWCLSLFNIQKDCFAASGQFLGTMYRNLGNKYLTYSTVDGFPHDVMAWSKLIGGMLQMTKVG